MHIGGAPGSGKTYLGKKIKSLYPDIKVIDSDQLKDKFIEKPIEENIKLMEELSKFKSYGKKTKKQLNLEKKYEENYRSYVVNKFEKLHKQKQKYILVGHFFMFDDFHIDVAANKKIFLDVDNETLFSRRNMRLLKDLNKNVSYFKGLIENGEEFWNYNYLWSFTNLGDVKKELTKSKKYYQKNKFKPLNEDKILEIVKKEME